MNSLFKTHIIFVNIIFCEKALKILTESGEQCPAFRPVLAASPMVERIRYPEGILNIKNTER